MWREGQTGEEASGSPLLRNGEVKGGSPYHQYFPGPISLSQDEKNRYQISGRVWSCCNHPGTPSQPQNLDSVILNGVVPG